MKHLLWLLLLGTSFRTLCQQTRLDVDFMFKIGQKERDSRTVQVNTVFFTDTEAITTLKCGPSSNFVLQFQVLEQNESGIKIKTEIADNDRIIAKPVMIVNYNQKGILELSVLESATATADFYELRLSIIPSQEEIATQVTQ